MEAHARSESENDPWLPQPYVVESVTRETEDTVTLELVAQGGEGPRFSSSAGDLAPGRFMMLYAFGVGEVPISIAGATPSGRLQHTVRDVGPVTHALCTAAPGAVIGVRGPFGSRWPIDDQAGRDVLIAAGGIGLAPLRPVIERVVERRANYDDVVVLYGARDPSQILYAHEFERWTAAGIQVEVTVDTADRAWTGHVGVVTTLIRYARFQASEAAAFACGPEIMMRFMAQELVQGGVAPDRIHVSLERNMKCAIGMCGRCQLGAEFLCQDGPVFPWPRSERLLSIPQL